MFYITEENMKTKMFLTLDQKLFLDRIHERLNKKTGYAVFSPEELIPEDPKERARVQQMLTRGRKLGLWMSSTERSGWNKALLYHFRPLIKVVKYE